MKFDVNTGAKLKIFNSFKKNSHQIIDEYKDFYNKYKDLQPGYYGLIAYGLKSPSNFYEYNYADTVEKDFLFTQECVWEDFDDEGKIKMTIEKVQYGSITISYEGCGIYWILITAGLKRGEIWLLTEEGVTPVSKNLEEWKSKIIENPIFWYEKIKQWGNFDYSVLYLHAAKKMIVAGEYVFGISSDLCRDCEKFMIKNSEKIAKEIVITSPLGTTVYKAGKAIKIKD